jgi:deazaflavin-dependent oxidoreductase (nitroreductase family)
MGTRPAQGTRGKELPRLAFQLATGSHVFWYRLTRGLLGHRLGPVKTLLLDHVGSRSEKRYTTPLTYGRDGQNLILVASKGGSAQHPAWYTNLVAHPDAEVQVGSRRMKVRARTASPDEKPRLWDLMTREWPGYDDYQRNTDREIPVVILEPR